MNGCKIDSQLAFVLNEAKSSARFFEIVFDFLSRKTDFFVKRSEQESTDLVFKVFQKQLDAERSATEADIEANNRKSDIRRVKRFAKSIEKERQAKELAEREKEAEKALKEKEAAEQRASTVSFKKLPYAVQLGIFEKFTFHKWIAFKECSSFSNSLSALQKDAFFPIKIAKLTFTESLYKTCAQMRVTTDALLSRMSLTDAHCSLIMKYVQKCRKFHVDSSVFLCSPEKFRSMIQMIGVQDLLVYGNVTEFQYDTSSLEKLFFYPAQLPLETIFEMKAERTYVVLTQHSARAILEETKKRASLPNSVIKRTTSKYFIGQQFSEEAVSKIIEEMGMGQWCDIGTETQKHSWSVSTCPIKLHGEMKECLRVRRSKTVECE